MNDRIWDNTLVVLVLTQCWILTEQTVCLEAAGDLKELQNAALHKNAIQSSLYSNNNGAELAVDGNNDPNFVYCSCTQNTDDVNWWQVDLGDIHHIVHVKLTNRLYVGERLHDFDIQVSNTSSMSPNDLCAHYVGTVPDGATETVLCDTVTVGRFLRVSKISNHSYRDGDHLQLCEVEVLVWGRKNLKVFRQVFKKVASSRPLLRVTHRLLCGQTCLRDSACVGFNYQEGTNICQLLYSTENPVYDTQWSMYSLNLM